LSASRFSTALQEMAQCMFALLPRFLYGGLSFLSSDKNKKTKAKTSGNDRGNIGPVRTKASGSTKPAAPKREKREKKQPRTAAELDSELDAFMGDSPADAGQSTAAPAEDTVMA
jgi:hypothetical protein